MKNLLKKIADRNAVIGIIGLGHTGLPLAISFVESGFSVFGIETDKQKIQCLRDRRSYDIDVSPVVIQRVMDSGRFHLHSNKQLPKELDCAVICVPTPLNKTKDPDISYVLNVSEQLSKVIRKNMVVVLQSTAYPGTTRELLLPHLEKKGLKVGIDFFLAYSPERLDPGNTQYNTKNIPRVVGGVTKKCTKVTKELFSAVVDDIVEASAETAEMVKLLENTFRIVNIGLINEMAIMCGKLGIDIWEVVKAASTKPFGYMPFYPGPGIGGHCIPVDPQYLSWKLRLLDYKARFVELAGEINAEMPEFIVNKISKILNEKSKAIKESKILLMGMAYKKNSDDYRESPSMDIMGMLNSMGAKVSYTDPYIPEINLENKCFKGKKLTSDCLTHQDLVVILTDHSLFDFRLVKDNAPLIYDTRNVYNGTRNGKIITL